MDTAVRIFLERKDVLSARLLSTIGEYLEPDEQTDDWVLYALCHDLLTLNPLQISASKQPSFWRILESVYFALSTDWGADRTTEHGAARYVVKLNDSERILTMNWRQALCVLLRTLVDPRLAAQLRSVNEIPHQLCVALLKRKGLRRFVINRLWLNVEDTLDVSKLFRANYINQKTLQDLLDMQLPMLDAGYYETPAREPSSAGHVDNHSPFDEQQMRRPPLPTRRHITQQLLEKRIGLSVQNNRFCSTWQLKLLCIAYRMLRIKLDHQLTEAASLPSQLLNVEFLFAMLDTTLQQSMDEESSRMSGLCRFYNHPELNDFQRTIDDTVAELAAFIRNQGTPPSQELLICRDETTQLAEELSVSFAQNWPLLVSEKAPVAKSSTTSIPTQWTRVKCVEMPLQLFFAVLESNACLFSQTLKVKLFLHGKERTAYLAYRMDTSCTLTHLSETLAMLQQRYSTEYPLLLSDICTVKVLSHVYMICRPKVQHNLHLLLILESIHRLGAVSSRGDFVLNIFLRAVFTARPNSKQHRFAVYCLVSALALLLGGRSLRQLLAPITSDAAYWVYARLPELMAYLVNSGTEVCRRSVASILALQTRQIQLNNLAATLLKQYEMDFTTDLELPDDLAARYNTAVSHNTEVCSRSCEFNGDMNQPDMTRTEQGKFIRMSVSHKDQVPQRFYTALLQNSSLLPAEVTTQLLENLSGVSKNCSNYTRELNRSAMEPQAATKGKAQNTLACLMSANSSILQEAQHSGVLEVDLPIELVSRRQMGTRGGLQSRLVTSLPSSEVLAAFLQIELTSRGGAEGLSQLYTLDGVVQDERVLEQLPLDVHQQLDFEDSFTIAYSGTRQAAAPLPDSLLDTPIHNVLDVDTLRELALQYNSDWQPGTLLDGTVYSGCYSNYLREVLNNEVLEVQPGDTSQF